MTRSKTTKNAICELYAILATAAAQRAVNRIKEWGNTQEADRLAKQAEDWLDQSSAEAIRWTYRRPTI